MDFLKDILGDGYAAFESKITAYNAANKDKPIKLANLTEGGYVSKDKFTTLETEANGYKTQLTELGTQIKERDTQLEELKKVDATGLQAKITELQEANKTAQTEYDNKLKAAQRDYKLETRLLQEGAVNTKAVKALLDLSKISIDGENLIGLDDQLTPLKEKEKWAFGAAQQNNQSGFRTGQQHGQGGGEPAATAADEIKNQLFGG